MAIVKESGISPLTAIDRCDRCIGQAYVKVDLGTGKSALLFCVHHGNQHFDALKTLDQAIIYDYRQIVVKQEAEPVATT